MTKTLNLRREALTELATSDLQVVRGAAVPTPVVTVGLCGQVLNVVRTVVDVTRDVTTAIGITDLC